MTEPNGADREGADGFWSEMAAAYYRLHKDEIARDVDATFRAVLDNIAALRTQLAADSPMDTWIATCTDITTELVDVIIELSVSSQGRVTPTDVFETVSPFAANYTSLLIAVAESGADLSPYGWSDRG